ncbi:MAG: DUF2007 domain-containing protein [Anaerolineae bacterium]|nr:DUF2007 domain-containing protein [Anaerolineae bacterium]MCX8068158.1 DUF2007 domain-containing protein [Anaerolineae bacterium]MDW7991476.1 DUF2007 domain-containing protein [Anaerolineae bacterium]
MNRQKRPLISRYIPVATVQGLLRAEVVRSYLRSQHIPVLLQYESAGRAIGITVDGLGEVRVLVPARLERKARRLLRSRRGRGRIRRVWAIPFPSRRRPRF